MARSHSLRKNRALQYLDMLEAEGKPLPTSPEPDPPPQSQSPSSSSRMASKAEPKSPSKASRSRASSPRAASATSAAAAPAAASPKPLTVTQLTSRVRATLENQLGEVWVEGELSNWKQHATSGHCYFSLKDENTQISAVMWRRAAMRIPFEPRNGMLVEVRGMMTFYEPQGRAQIVVEDMHEAGVGLLWKKFLELRDRLEREGLFAPERKRPLPELPSRVGVVTSPSGAAIRDILNVLTRRFAGLQVVLWPAKVQGDGAAQDIAHGIQRMGELDLCDVLIVGRGGGSMEDLWAFNEEVVARAIAACPVPVISAVGHEVDFTIADFVADMRAPTPSAAAEMVVGEKAALIEGLLSGRERLGRAMLRLVEQRRAQVERLAGSYALTEPRARLFQAMQRRDELVERLDRAMRVRALAVTQTRTRVEDLRSRLGRSLERSREGILAERRHVAQFEARLAAAVRGQLPRIEASRREAAGLEGRLVRVTTERIESSRRAVESLRSQLKALDPNGVLRRGYAIVRRSRDGRIVRDPKHVRLNDQITAQLAEGRIRAIVVKDEEDLFG